MEEGKLLLHFIRADRTKLRRKIYDTFGCHYDVLKREKPGAYKIVRLEIKVAD